MVSAKKTIRPSVTLIEIFGISASSSKGNKQKAKDTYTFFDQVILYLMIEK